MALSETTRLGLTRWSAGVDPFNRDQMDQSHERLEARAGMFFQGGIAGRPAASAAYARAFYLATDQNAPTGILYYCNGSNWHAVNNFAAPSALNPGDSIAEGTATTAARSDHKHSLPAWGVVGEIANVDTVASAGSASKFARVDHVHVLGNGAVTAGKIATGGVSASNQIANGIIVASHLAAGSVTAAAISEDQRVPVGGIIMYTGTTAPTGYLMCNGGAYSTTTYSGLFAIIGYKYGGSGGTFNVPDLRDRVPRGASTPNSTAALAVAAGADTVELTTSHLPVHAHGVGTLGTAAVGNHQHTVSGNSGVTNIDHVHSASSGSAGSHTHLVYTGNWRSWVTVELPGSAGFSLQAGSQTVSSFNSLNTDPAGAHTHTISVGSMTSNQSHAHTFNATSSAAGGHSHTISGSTANAGSGTAFSIVPKSLTVNFLIKI